MSVGIGQCDDEAILAVDTFDAFVKDMTCSRISGLAADAGAMAFMSNMLTKPT